MHHNPMTESPKDLFLAQQIRWGTPSALKRSMGVLSQRLCAIWISRQLTRFKAGCAQRQFHHCHKLMAKSTATPLCGQLEARIRVNGPLTVADYMKEVLINPSAGYYMHKDVFGREGDFITSPEISQMFGEMLGVWCVNEWLESGSPTPVRFVELGPGRGTLTDDILRVFHQLASPLLKELSVHLVEVSPHLSQVQRAKLIGLPVLRDPPTNANTPQPTCISRHGPPVSWHKTLADVPRGNFSFIIAHEFFDALPIHKFQKKDGVWCEVLVDVDSSPDGPHHLRYVLSPGSTTASSLLLENVLTPDDKRDTVEVCPEAGAVVQEIAGRLHADGGCALLADYGHSGEKTDTFRAFRQHELHDPLCEPGTADLTADVDFSYLAQAAADQVSVSGPVTQRTFLYNMGIAYRLKAIFDTGRVAMDQRKALISGYDMLINPEKMGERFKFLSLHTNRPEDYIPSGFKPLT